MSEADSPDGTTIAPLWSRLGHSLYTPFVIHYQQSEENLISARGIGFGSGLVELGMMMVI